MDFENKYFELKRMIDYRYSLEKDTLLKIEKIPKEYREMFMSLYRYFVLKMVKSIDEENKKYEELQTKYTDLQNKIANISYKEREILYKIGSLPVEYRETFKEMYDLFILTKLKDTL